MVYKEILVYGNNFLRKKAQEVESFDKSIKVLVQNMFDTMYKAKGIGLAAPQIGVSKRVIVLDLANHEGPKLALVNPVIILRSRLTFSAEEGCLSVPAIRKEVERSRVIELKAFDPNGKIIEMKARDLLSRVIQHETDHLDGILFVDRIDEKSRAGIKEELKQMGMTGKIAVA